MHAGEPGASVPNVRTQIQSAWGIENVVDHVGATELGAWGYTCGHANHMHIIETEFVAEVIDPNTAERVDPDPDGTYRGEMVLTNLGRTSSPLIRYRTGDHVELTREPCPYGRNTAVLRGGVLGRVDQMLVVRGINIYPSALENLIRSFPEVEEFEVEVRHERNMAELLIRIEVNDGQADEVAIALRDHVHRQLSLRPQVETAQNLPRYGLKARRFKF